jgi:putative hydroxymethylpyrimidine transport system substrate-binding protein
MRRAALVAALTALLIAGCGGDDTRGARPLTLALDFQPNAVHAGVYSAVGEGLDRDHGIDLRVRAPSASTDSLKLLAAGRADASIVDIHDLGLARQRGEDVVGIGAIVQRPLAAVIARSASRPRALAGRRVGVTGLPSDDAVLDSVLRTDGARPGAVTRTTIGFSAVPSLAAGRVAAVVTFWNAEGVALRRRGVRTHEFRVDRYGAPRYPELVLAVRRRTLTDHRPRLRGLLATLRAGTASALAHPDAAARRVARASDTDLPLVRAQLRAVAPALRPSLRLDPAALRAWARFDVRFGILRRPPDVRRAFAFGL